MSEPIGTGIDSFSAFQLISEIHFSDVISQQFLVKSDPPNSFEFITKLF